MGLDVSLGAAFLAGLISFLSPCVLPLVPPYLTFLAGISFEELIGHETEKPSFHLVLLPAAFFVLGFSTVFVILGATASVVGQLLREHLTLLSQIAGIAIIIMGVHFLGLFRLAFLSRDTRYSHASRPAGLFGAYIIGLAFAFGWTPCIGPVLAVILAVAASEESVPQGAFLLAVYSAGLGVPFMAAAIGIEEFLAFLNRFRAHFRLMERGMGALLVVTGIMFLTGFMQTMSYWILETFPALGRLG